MSLREDVELYTKLSGEDGSQETIATIGAYLRGYGQGKADAEPKRGKWVDDGDPLMLTCGNCGYAVMRYNNTPFCPNCGAKMEVTE